MTFVTSYNIHLWCNNDGTIERDTKLLSRTEWNPGVLGFIQVPGHRSESLNNLYIIIWESGIGSEYLVLDVKLSTSSLSIRKISNLREMFHCSFSCKTSSTVDSTLNPTWLSFCGVHFFYGTCIRTSTLSYPELVPSIPQNTLRCIFYLFPLYQILNKHLPVPPQSEIGLRNFHTPPRPPSHCTDLDTKSF